MIFFFNLVNFLEMLILNFPLHDLLAVLLYTYLLVISGIIINFIFVKYKLVVVSIAHPKSI